MARMVIVLDVTRHDGTEVSTPTVDPHDLWQEIIGMYGDESPGFSWPIEGEARLLAAEWEDNAQRHGLQKMLDADGGML